MKLAEEEEQITRVFLANLNNDAVITAGKYSWMDPEGGGGGIESGPSHPLGKITTGYIYIPGPIAQSVTCLATDASLTADPGVPSSIPARSHTFVEIDHEIISTVILLPPLNHSRRVVVSYKRKYVHEVLVNCLFKLAQEKVWIGQLTVPP